MYVMSYFTTAVEALHLATSADGHEFSPVNGGRPVLRSQVGLGALRDPFIGAGPDGDYHLLATDGWTSTSVVHARSTDLRRWSPTRLIPVMAAVPDARNVWAPEFFVDPATGLAHLIWSSVVGGRGVEERDWQNIGQEHRIWHSQTDDFSRFSDPTVFFEPGHAVIDATVHSGPSGFLMAYKDERGTNQLTTAHKNILVTSFTEPGGEFGPVVGPVSPAPVEGPAFFRRDDALVLIFEHYLEGRYGAVSTEDLVSWSPTSVGVPAGARHASVLTI